MINVLSVGGFVAQPTTALYAGTKFAVRAICVYQGVTNTEITSTISDETARKSMGTYRKSGIESDAIGHAIQFAIEQPDDVDMNEIVVHPIVTQV